MDHRVKYRSAKQEARRRGLISKIFALGKRNGMERGELYENIKSLGERRLIVFFGYNYKGRGEEKRVSLSSLRLYQLERIINALFGGMKKKVNGEKNADAKVVAYEDWKKSKKK